MALWMPPLLCDATFRKSCFGFRSDYLAINGFRDGTFFFLELTKGSFGYILSSKKDGSFNTEGTVLPEVTCEKSFFVF